MRKHKPPDGPVGVIGFGLMGRGIGTCLLANDLALIAHERSSRQAAVLLGVPTNNLVQIEIIDLIECPC
jgi:3-hydroxyisobutyrate dehydrogenase-like beta-hydroxyacid dehydrogenase